LDALHAALRDELREAAHAVGLHLEGRGGGGGAGGGAGGGGGAGLPIKRLLQGILAQLAEGRRPEEAGCGARLQGGGRATVAVDEELEAEAAQRPGCGSRGSARLAGAAAAAAAERQEVQEQQQEVQQLQHRQALQMRALAEWREAQLRVVSVGERCGANGACAAQVSC
jgi:hypothetical protein